jgi:hypothetical protein
MLAYAELAYLVIAVGLSILAGQLLKPKQSFARDDKPTTLAQRGAYAPRIIGRRRVGAIFAWAGDRSSHKEAVPGGKGSFLFPGAKQEVFSESGWHLLCVGPAEKLHRIYQNGEIIFEGPITIDSHPSGSTIDLGNEGRFRIYWGSLNQSINTDLGDPTRVDVTSRWPGLCYVHWIGKRLGTSATWPLLDYVVECRPSQTYLSNTPAYMEPTRTLSDDVLTLTEVVNGGPGIGYIRFFGDVSRYLKPGRQVRIEGNAMGDQDLEVLRTTLVNEPDPMNPFVILTFTHLFVTTSIAGSDNNGTVTPYDEAEDDGINLAHTIADLLFSPWPHGGGMPQDEVDMDSLEELGELIVAENIRGSTLAKDGEQCDAVIASILQDLGCMFPFDPDTGLLRFSPIREPSGTLPIISADLIVDEEPEIENLHLSPIIDRPVFEFTDRLNNYRTMTLGVSDDGTATLELNHRNRSVQIANTVNFDTAARIVVRRAQEELAGAALLTIKANRAARYLKPGQAVVVDGIDEVCRVMNNHPADPLSGKTELKVNTDFYGVPLSDFIADPGNTGSTPVEAEQDPGFAVYEVPEFILAGQPQTVVFLRQRAHANVVGANLHISRDDVTYTFGAQDRSLMAGGVLLEALPDTADFVIAQGPTFTTSGPDNTTPPMLDLSGDLISWQNGRQMAVINGELFYVQKVTAVSGSTYRLDGLLRARLDTVRESHAIGDRVYVLQNEDGVPIQDVLIEPEVTLYGKSQPFGTGQVALDTIGPVTVDLYGKGVRPMPVPADTIRNTVAGNRVVYWPNGATMTISWSWFSPRAGLSGAGHIGAGTIQAPVAPEGDFVVEILTSLLVLKRTFTQTASTFSYTAAQRTTDFGAEPTSFVLRITQTRDGRTADASSVLFTRVG